MKTNKLAALVFCCVPFLATGQEPATMPASAPSSAPSSMSASAPSSEPASLAASAPSGPVFEIIYQPYKRAFLIGIDPDGRAWKKSPDGTLAGPYASFEALLQRESLEVQDVYCVSASASGNRNDLSSLSKKKDLGVALALSWGLTLAGGAFAGLAHGDGEDGLAAFSGGLALLAPSFGHLYAKEPGHALLFSGLRAASGAAWLLEFSSRATPDSSLLGSDHRAVSLLCVSAVVGLTLYDLFDSAFAVRRYNHKLTK